MYRKIFVFFCVFIITPVFFTVCSRPDNGIEAVFENAEGPVLTEIRITGTPDKKEYKMGEELVTSGLIVENVYLDGSIVETGDYTVHGNTFTPGPCVITVASAIDASKTASFTIEVTYGLINSGLPALKIDTSGTEINSTETWIEGAVYTLYDPSGTVISEGGASVKGRGNSTWGMPKKPYSLKLDTATGILGMPPHKRWNLLANYSDKTLLRTETAFRLGAVFDNLAWTPRSEQADLYINDRYLGVYQITEAIKIDANRVNISKIKKSDPDGGYILDIDARKGEEFNFTTTAGVVFCCSDPDEDLDKVIKGDTRTLFEKIREDVQKAEDVLYSADFADPDTGYNKYLDSGSFADWYLVNEITKNNDAIFYLSVYMYFDPVKKKYCMGPLWDFDISQGNINYNDNDRPEGFWIKNSRWIARLFEDPVFVALVKARWNEKKTDLDGITGFIDGRAASLSSAAGYNFRKWPILDRYVWPNAVVTGSYDGETAYLKSWLGERINWLDGAINGL